MQCSAVQCSAVQCSAVQCSAVQCSAVQCSAVQCSAVQCSAVQSRRGRQQGAGQQRSWAGMPNLTNCSLLILRDIVIVNVLVATDSDLLRVGRPTENALEPFFVFIPET